MRGSAWDEDVEHFFKSINPHLRGEGPFIKLDLLEYLVEGPAGPHTASIIAVRLRIKPERVREALDHLVKARVVVKDSHGDGFRFAPTSDMEKPLRRFMELYRTTLGRLRVIERILGW